MPTNDTNGQNPADRQVNAPEEDNQPIAENAVSHGGRFGTQQTVPERTSQGTTNATQQK